MGKIVVQKKAKKVLGDLTNEAVAKLRQRGDKSLKRALHGKSILQVSKETWKRDPFSDIPVIPGVKKYKNPSIEKFLAGKTSIFSIAKSIDEEVCTVALDPGELGRGADPLDLFPEARGAGPRGADRQGEDGRVG